MKAEQIRRGARLYEEGINESNSYDMQVKSGNDKFCSWVVDAHKISASRKISTNPVPHIYHPIKTLIIHPYSASLPWLIYHRICSCVVVACNPHLLIFILVHKLANKISSWVYQCAQLPRKVHNLLFARPNCTLRRKNDLSAKWV